LRNRHLPCNFRVTISKMDKSSIALRTILTLSKRTRYFAEFFGFLSISRLRSGRHIAVLPPLVLVLGFIGAGIGAPPAEAGRKAKETADRTEALERPRLEAVSTGDAPVIDGILSEPVWRSAALIPQLTQVEPDEGGVSTERTEVRILFDKDYLYIGVRCYDGAPSRIRATEMERDAEFESDDYVTIVFDTFLDSRNGYFFSTNPLGARTDGLIENNRRVKGENWDGIWYVKSSIDSEGWVVEFAIPFKTVSFDEKQTAWGFNIERTIRRKSEIDRWSGTGIARSVEEVALAGRITGLEGIRQGLGLDIVPGVTATAFHRPEGSPGDEKSMDPSLDVFYRITPSLMAAVTFNTDFAETEVDERELNFDRFDLFFPEKRDFFLKDAGIFEFGGLERNGKPFFSRKIGLDDEGREVGIIAGAKTTGRHDNLNIGILAVRQDESANRGPTNLYVLRPSLNVLKESALGCIFTHGNPIEDEGNSVAGVDFQYRNSEIIGEKVFNAGIWFQKAFRTGIDDRDIAYGMNLNYPNEPIEWSLGFQEIQKEFRPGLGFVNRKGIRQYEGEGRYRWRFRPDGYVRFLDSGFSAEVVEKISDNFIETAAFSWNALRVDNRHGDRIQVGCRRQYEELDEDFEIHEGIVIPKGAYPGNRFFGKILTSPQRWLSGGIEVEFGDFFDGNRTQLKPYLQFRPSRFIFFSAEFDYNDVSLLNGGFQTHLIKSRIRFQFTPDITWNTLLQWDNESGVLGAHSVFRWTIEPGRDIYIVISHASGDDKQTDDFLEGKATEFTGKLQWTFRF